MRTRRAIQGTEWFGIPVTSAAETVVDLAASLTDDELARIRHEAAVKHHLRPAQVDAVLVRRHNAMGGAKLRAVVSGDTPVTLSALERRFLSLIDEGGFPRPITNKPAGTKRVDCRWPEHRLTVELDSYRFHNSRYSWEQDRRREREARARGDDFRRFSFGDVFENPGAMMRELSAALSAGTSR